MGKMDVKEKLVELIDDFIHNVDLKHWYSEELDEKLADDLIAHGVTVQEWIPVTERLPKANGRVLCWWQSDDGEREHYGFAWYQNHNVWYVSNEGMPNVTHWMPLPEAPKGE